MNETKKPKRMSIGQHFASRIRERMRDRNITSAGLAKRYGVTVKDIRNWLGGREGLAEETANAVLSELNLCE